MAELPELNEWPEGIYQLETSDPVLGGPDGIDNLQAKQLASRTKWLKDQLGKIVSGASSVGKAVQLRTPRTLKFIGAITGSGTYDGSADTEIALAWADSGVEAGSFTKVSVSAKGLVTGGSNPTTLTGYGITDALRIKGGVSNADLNTVVTDGRYSGSGITNAPDTGFWYVDVQQHGSDGKYCRQTLWRITGGNTEQLQRHQNNGVWTPFIKAKTERGMFSIATSQTLTVNHMGLVNADATSGDREVTLPASDAALGIQDVMLRRVDNSANKLTIKAAGTDKVKFHTHLSAAGYGFFYLMGAGDWWHLRSDGVGGWYVLGRLDSTPLGRPTFETTIAFPPGGNGPLAGVLYNRADWPWLWDHAQASGMLTTEGLRAGLEGCWTSGDGSLTFRGPDVRGEFLRALDEKRGVEKDVIYGNLTIGSPTVTAVSFIGSTFGSGATISGTGIPVGTTVLSVNVAAGTITMSANATAAGSTSITVIGRQSGSSQAGTPNNIDTGASNAVLSGKVSGISDPGVARVGFAMDEGDITKYHASAGQFAIGATNGGAFSMGTEVSWGVVRPRNIAYPGRIKLI